MPSTFTKDCVRWAVIVSSGCLGLYFVYAVGSELWASRARPDFGMMLLLWAIFGLVTAFPCLLVTVSLLKRHDPEAVNVLAWIVALSVFLLSGDILTWAGIDEFSRARPGDGVRWFGKMTFPLFALALRYYLAKAAFVLCKRLGYRYLVGQSPTDTKRRVA